MRAGVQPRVLRLGGRVARQVRLEVVQRLRRVPVIDIIPTLGVAVRLGEPPSAPGPCGRLAARMFGWGSLGAWTAASASERGLPKLVRLGRDTCVVPLPRLMTYKDWELRQSFCMVSGGQV